MSNKLRLLRAGCWACQKKGAKRFGGDWWNFSLGKLSPLGGRAGGHLQYISAPRQIGFQNNDLPYRWPGAPIVLFPGNWSSLLSKSVVWLLDAWGLTSEGKHLETSGECTSAFRNWNTGSHVGKFPFMRKPLCKSYSPATVRLFSPLPQGLILGPYVYGCFFFGREGFLSSVSLSFLMCFTLTSFLSVSPSFGTF